MSKPCPFGCEERDGVFVWDTDCPEHGEPWIVFAEPPGEGIQIDVSESDSAEDVKRKTREAIGGTTG